ncbi:ATP-grasp fold amidoligase family protein [uncultured Clostridium sp.]|uniref:ATP-grasp fold amidoligase family protein n=1 Tax=uncultured Clostridium sp. TaxID=59620 RepID=UPI0026387861|nr:ATP-grasp fold amidoligase family protein [uncultured Clostridium sp.]
MKQKIKNIIKENKLIFNLFNDFRFKVIYKTALLVYDDETYIRKQYKFKFKKELNLVNPQTFNEKIQWLKLKNRNPILKQCVDKFEVREYVASKIGNEFLNEVYGVYTDAMDIDFDAFPKSFVLKTTLGGGGLNVIICKDKDLINKNCIIKKLNKWLKHDGFSYGREWPYKREEKRKGKILCEKYLVSNNNKETNDYKFYCFNGEPKYFHINYERNSVNGKCMYNSDMSISDKDYIYGNKVYLEIEENQKENIIKMMDLARKLSQDFDFVRVDFFMIDNKIYFSELTFYPLSGLIKFYNDETDKIWGNELKITNKTLL